MAASFIHNAWLLGQDEGDRTRTAPSSSLDLAEAPHCRCWAHHPFGPDAEHFDALANRIGDALASITELPMLPSEIEDVLGISSRERHKWLEDGRLRSVGTRTVKLRGRARAVTFHVFDPQSIETILDGDLATIWREEDAIRSADNRRRAAAKAALARKLKAASGPSGTERKAAEEAAPGLAGWDEFDADGLLR